DVRAELRGPAARHLEHRRAEVDAHDLLDLRRIERQVLAGADRDLEHAAARAAERLAAQRPHAEPLGDGLHPVVGAGDRVVLRADFLLRQHAPVPSAGCGPASRMKGGCGWGRPVHPSAPPGSPPPISPPPGWGTVGIEPGGGVRGRIGIPPRTSPPAVYPQFPQPGCGARVRRPPGWKGGAEGSPPPTPAVLRWHAGIPPKNRLSYTNNTRSENLNPRESP